MSFNPYSKNFDFKEKNLIEASAGTGKTYSISTIYLRLIIEEMLLPPEILTVTFTNDAVWELKERIRMLLLSANRYLENGNNDIDDNLRSYLDKLIEDGKKENTGIRLKEALLLMDESAIYTIHGFCKRVLSEYPVRANAPFGAELSHTDRDILSELVYYIYRKWLYAEDEYLISYFLKRFSDEKVASLITRFQSYVDPKIQVGDVSLIEIKECHLRLLEEFSKEKEKHKNGNKKIKEFFQNAVVEDNFYPLLKFDSQLKDRLSGLFEIYQKLNFLLDKYIFSKIFALLRENEEKFSRIKLEKGTITFDDIIRYVFNAVKVAEGFGEGYKALLVDEFQDTDFLQVYIFEKIFSDKPIFLIGDPKQSIYGFRGADLDAYFFATEKVKKENCFYLDVCYRSRPGLVKFFNHMFSKENFFADDRIEYKPVESAIEDSNLRTEDDYKNVVMTVLNGNKGCVIDEMIYEIRRLVSCDKAKIGLSDICIIVPTNSDAEYVREELSKADIVSVVNSTKSVFESSEAKELFIVLDALENFTNSVKIRSALVTSLFNKRIDELDDDTVAEYKVRFSEYASNLLEKGVISAFTSIMEKERSKNVLLRKEKGERVYTNYLHLIELMQKAFHSQIVTFEKLKSWLAKRITKGERSADDYELRLESDEDAVGIYTIHRSKGLEFPIVFLPFFDFVFNEKVTENLVSEFSNGRHLVKFDEDNSFLREKDFAEKMRLFYVALTRAKERCYLFDYNARNTIKNKRYLNKIFYSQSSLPSYEERLKILRNDFGNVATVLSSLKEQEIRGKSERKEKIVLNKHEFKGEIKSKFRIGSYSSMIGGIESYNEYSIDDLFFSDDTTKKILLKPGASTGVLVHKILEEIDFETDSDELKKEVFKAGAKFGLNYEELTYLFAMIKNLLKKRFELNGKPFSFDSVNLSERYSEKEFYMQVNNMRGFLDKLEDILGEEFSFAIGKISKNVTESRYYIRGFIDLLFKFEDKIYLVDWKSNYLGDDLDDYSTERLRSEFIENYYFLQAVFYQLAIYKFLKNFKVPAEVGEVLYVFTRGFSPETGCGLYRFSLKKEDLDELGRYCE